MSKRPLIGLIGGLYKSGDGEPVYGLPQNYAKSLAAEGASPIIIAPNIEPAALQDLFDRCDGVLIAGGGDVDPARYGMSAEGLVHGIDEARDEAEIQFVRWAVAEDKPLLGICRGMQVSNVALGGSLYRDITQEIPGASSDQHNYWGKQARSYIGHEVNVMPDSTLGHILGATLQPVNSLHHQALKTVAEPLKVVAYSALDNIVEGVEIPNAKFFVGVQWHPEELYQYSDSMRKLFAAFIAATRS